jgi:hypothetical protein
MKEAVEHSANSKQEMPIVETTTQAREAIGI